MQTQKNKHKMLNEIWRDDDDVAYPITPIQPIMLALLTTSVTTWTIIQFSSWPRDRQRNRTRDTFRLSRNRTVWDESIVQEEYYVYFLLCFSFFRFSFSFLYSYNLLCLLDVFCVFFAVNFIYFPFARWQRAVFKITMIHAACHRLLALFINKCAYANAFIISAQHRAQHIAS